MKTVCNFFEEIMNIPRESGKEEKIARYLVNYAEENGLEYSVGKYNTIFMRKNNHSTHTIILQAHSDMVCVSSEKYDFDNKGIPFYIDGDYYRSKNTSLGADDGIGIAIILAILQETKNMPNIEVVITTQEETTMLGAFNFDYTKITGKTLISLDGIMEGDIESSSAGMCSIELQKTVQFEEIPGNAYRLHIDGLAGGHSGDDIHKNRKNAIKLAFDVLKKLDCIGISDVSFGTKDNVIPSTGSIIFHSKKELEELQGIIKDCKWDLEESDKKLIIRIERVQMQKCLNVSKQLVALMDSLESGVIESYPDDGFPLLSANIGSIQLRDNIIQIKYSIRSSDKEKEESYIEKIQSKATAVSFEMNIVAKKPFFAFKEHSEIRSLLSSTYKSLYKKNAIVKKVHACMEGGILSENIPNLDICTIAPTISNCHSIKECVSISSTNRVYEWLKQTLIKYNSI